MVKTVAELQNTSSGVRVGSATETRPRPSSSPTFPASRSLSGATITTDDFVTLQAFSIIVANPAKPREAPLFLSAGSLRERDAWVEAMQRAAEPVEPIDP